MPRKLDAFTFSVTSTAYPYETLLNGEVWQCYPGEDFHCAPNSFAQTMYTAGRRRGKRVRCRVMNDGSVVLQAWADAEPSAATPAAATPATPEPAHGQAQSA